MTIFLSFKTKSIDKTLSYIATAKKYNNDKIRYREKFKGHKSFIDHSGLNRRLATDLLIDVYSFLAEYKSLLSFVENFKIKYIIVSYLKKDYSKLDAHKTNQYLAYIIGRLSKEEDAK